MNRIKNKWLIHTLLLGLLITIAPGCKKYLEQEPENSLTRDDFFKTEADANAAIMGVYDGLQACAEKFLTWGEFRGDLVSPNINNDNTYLYFQLFENNRPASVWAQPYTYRWFTITNPTAPCRVCRPISVRKSPNSVVFDRSNFMLV